MASTWSSPSAGHRRWSGARATISSRSRFCRAVLFCGILIAAIPPAPAGARELIDHPSPYLRDHAADAIRWLAPEDGAIAEARRSGRPILVSSGYLSCYWCHRMKQETFSDRRLAERVNRDFVPVLMDREMHAEDDRLLQAFMRRARGFGGWPVVAILTPEGEPVQAWPFISANDLSKALQRFTAEWRENGAAVARKVREANRAAAGERGPEGRSTRDIAALLSAFLDQTGEASDTEFGGFGRAEKHPYVPQFQALLDLHQLNPSDAMAGFVRFTIDRMLAGELLDPLEGGVFRYTENRDWTGPHFEQMLYTQALLSRLLFRAANALGERAYAEAGGRILGNMLAHYATPSGLMIAALSAVGQDGINGSYFLPSERDLAIRLGDNWATKVSIRQQIEGRALVEPVGPLSEVTRQVLLDLRAESGRPRDDKRLLAWNGLALSALSHGLALDAGFRQPAMKLAAALLSLSEVDPLPLMASGNSGPEADISGYIYVAGGLFDWWQASGDDSAIERVVVLLERAAERYHDGAGWLRGRALVLAGSDSPGMLPDDQLPSPSAEWLRLADALAVAGLTVPEKVSDVSRQMVAGWPQALEEQAFFHATLVTALVTRRLLGIN